MVSDHKEGSWGCSIMHYLCVFCHKKSRGTDGPTDRRTDGPTDRPSYRDARTHLKINGESLSPLAYEDLRNERIFRFISVWCVHRSVSPFSTNQSCKKPSRACHESYHRAIMPPNMRTHRWPYGPRFNSSSFPRSFPRFPCSFVFLRPSPHSI